MTSNTKDGLKTFSFKLRPSTYESLREVYCEEDVSWDELFNDLLEVE